MFRKAILALNALSILPLAVDASFAVYGGHATFENDHVWRSVVEVSFADRSYCGGTLIGPRIVLTAAHCLRRPTGPPQLPQLVRFFGPMGVTIDQRMVDRAGFHSGFSYRGTDDDIAVLLMSGDAPAGYAAARIASRDSPELSKDTEIIVAGVGLAENRIRTELRFAFMPLTAVTESLLLAKDDLGRTGSCYGDSGGPAFISVEPNPGKKELLIVGITSRAESPDCSKRGLGIFTRVSHYQEWLDAAVAAVKTGKTAPDVILFPNE